MKDGRDGECRDPLHRSTGGEERQFGVQLGRDEAGRENAGRRDEREMGDAGDALDLASESPLRSHRGRLFAADKAPEHELLRALRTCDLADAAEFPRINDSPAQAGRAPGESEHAGFFAWRKTGWHMGWIDRSGCGTSREVVADHRREVRGPRAPDVPPRDVERASERVQNDLTRNAGGDGQEEAVALPVVETIGEVPSEAFALRSPRNSFALLLLPSQRKRLIEHTF